MYIPPAPWATSGLEVVPGKLPLSQPSPRASDPAGLDQSRAHIAFAKVYQLPSEIIQKFNPNLAISMFAWASTPQTIRNTERGDTRGNQANIVFAFFSICSLHCSRRSCRLSFLHTPGTVLKRSRFWTDLKP